MTPVQTLTADALHTFNLGVVQAYCKVAIWRVLDGVQWRGPLTNAEERLGAALVCLKSDLRAFYRRHGQEHPTEHLTMVNDISMKMVGTRSSPVLHMSAAESYGFALYLADALGRFRASVGQDAEVLREAGVCLARVQRLSRTTFGKVPPAVLQEISRVMGEKTSSHGVIQVKPTSH